MSKRVRSQKEQIYNFIRRRPKSGATRKEIESRLGLLHQTVGPRVRELVLEGAVVEAYQTRDNSRVLIAQ